MGIKVAIKVVEGPDAGESLTLEARETIFGRKRADYILRDNRVSGRHFVLRREDDNLIIEDLGSTNGTFVNDVRIKGPTQLRNRDEISIGYSRLRVSIVEDISTMRPKKKKKRPRTLPPPSDEPLPTQSKISEMIDEELKRFSRWDLSNEVSSVRDFGERLQMPQVELTLDVLEGPDKGRHIRITKGNSTIGRGKAEIRIRDKDISRTHASIESFSAKQIFLRDLASTNGTFLNQKKVSYARLNDGDIIQIGSTVMRFHMADL